MDRSSKHNRPSEKKASDDQTLILTQTNRDYLDNYVQLKWTDINYSIKSSNKVMTVLDNVSGTANPGEIFAIMGSSGAGKTTLLNILANKTTQKSHGRLSGRVTLNGKNIKKINYNKHSAYVMQEDILYPTLTPREALMFAARIRCQGSIEEKMIKVEKIIRDLGIIKISDNIIGSIFLKGLSGGEKKRVCIGIEMISEPSMIILDEPTSGLDSYTAEIVIDLLVKQAEKGKTILATIHQPSTSIFNKFHKLLLLSEGHAIYQGPCNKARRYFKDLGFRCSHKINPADYFLRILHISDRNNKTIDEENSLNLFIENYKEIESELKYDITPLDKTNVYHAGFLEEFKQVFIRSLKHACRNTSSIKLRLLISILIGLIISIIFNNLGTDIQSIQNRSGVLYFVCI